MYKLWMYVIVLPTVPFAFAQAFYVFGVSVMVCTCPTVPFAVAWRVVSILQTMLKRASLLLVTPLAILLWSKMICSCKR